MHYGITFDESILKEKPLEHWLNHLSALGYYNLEISPDESILAKSVYQDIAKLSSNLNMSSTFHVPYFTKNLFYEIEYFKSYKEEVKQAFINLLNLIDSMKYTDKTSQLVIHGPAYQNHSDMNKALEQSFFFCDWLLNILHKRDQDITVAFETVPKSKEHRIGNDRLELMTLVDEFQSDRLKICWDLTHDMRNTQGCFSKPTDGFYRSVDYIHIHGFDTISETDHISLVPHISGKQDTDSLHVKKSTYDFTQALTYLHDQSYSGLVNIELLNYAAKENNESAVIADIKSLKQFYEALKSD